MSAHQIFGLAQMIICGAITVFFCLVLFDVIPMPEWGMWLVGALGAYNLASFFKGLYDRRSTEPTGTAHG